MRYVLVRDPEVASLGYVKESGNDTEILHIVECRFKSLYHLTIIQTCSVWIMVTGSLLVRIRSDSANI